MKKALVAILGFVVFLVAYLYVRVELNTDGEFTQVSYWLGFGAVVTGFVVAGAIWDFVDDDECIECAQYHRRGHPHST